MQLVEQLRAGVSRTELDYAEIQARLPKPPGRPRKEPHIKRG